MKVLNQITPKVVKTVKTTKPMKVINAEVAETAKRVLPYASLVAATVLANNVFDVKKEEQQDELTIDKDFLEVLSQDLGKHKYMDKYDVYYLAQNFEYAPAFVADLIMQKDDFGNLRVLRKDIIAPVFEAYQINPKYTEELVSEKNEEGFFRYSPEEIKTLVEISASEKEVLELATKNPMKIQELLAKENKLGNKLYTSADIQTILKIEESGDEYGKALLRMKIYTQSKEERFTPLQVNYISKKHQKYPELVDYLVESKSTTEYYYYDSNEIIDILKNTNDENVRIVGNLLNAKEYYSDHALTLLEKRAQSESDLLIYCAENHSNKLKQLLKDLEIDAISQETFDKIKAHRTEEYRYYWLKGYKKVKAPLPAHILKIFEELVKPNMSK